MIGAAGKPFAPAGERLGQFPIKVALVQFLLGQSASRFFVAPSTNGKHQALALLQIRLHNNRWVHFTFLLRDRHSEGRHTICPYDSKTYMLLSTRDDRTQATWNKGDLTWRCRIVRADFERHRDRHFTTRTSHDAYQAMTGAIFACPGIIVQFAELPGAQRLHRHKIRQHNFPGGTGKGGLENIAPAQVAL